MVVAYLQYVCSHEMPSNLTEVEVDIGNEVVGVRFFRAGHHSYVRRGIVLRSSLLNVYLHLGTLRFVKNNGQF